jgi:sec-independent protein translocase protein TatA
MRIFGLGTPELILILVVFLLFFGKDKIPELARSVGRSFKALKAGFKDVEDIKDEIESNPTNKSTSDKKDTSKK